MEKSWPKIHRKFCSKNSTLRISIRFCIALRLQIFGHRPLFRFASKLLNLSLKNVQLLQDQSESFSSIESGGFTFVDTRDELPTYMDTTRNDSSRQKRSAMSRRCNYFSSTFAKRLLTGFTSSLAPQQKSVQKRLQTLLSWNFLYMCRNVTKLSMHTILPILALVMYYFSVNGYIEPAELAIGILKFLFDGKIKKKKFKLQSEK